MRLSISARLVLLVALLVTASATTIGYYLYKSSSHILVNHALEDLSHSLQRDGDQFSNHIQELQRDVLFLAESPPIPGLIRTAQHRGYDPVGKSSKAQWLARLSRLFQAMLSTNPDYFQVRLLDATGQEILKLAKTDNTIKRFSPQALQNKVNTPYFQTTKSIGQGRTHLSSINLNREFGKISQPHTPVLRCATPIYQAGKLFGIIVINLDFSQYLSQLEKTYGASNETLYVTNSNGAYLSHPDPDKRFAFELGHYFRLQEDFPALANLFAPSNNELSRNIIPDNLAGNIMVFVKIPLEESKPDKFIAVGLERSYSQILADETKVLQQSLGIIALFILLSIIFALGFGNLLVRPLKQIVTNLDSYSKGDKPAMPIQRSDEIGILARALETMADNIFTSHQELRTLNARLEDEVEERTAEVQQHLQIVNAINQTQSLFIQDQNPNNAFEVMLSSLLSTSQSEFGFIGEVLHDEEDKPYLRIYVTTNIAWNDETRKFYENNVEAGLEFHNLDNLFGQVVLTGETIISNDPANDPRSKGLPAGHPGLHTFMGIPIHYSGETIGMVAIANRANGYNETLLKTMAPFLSTCASMILADQTRMAAEQSAIALSKTQNELERLTNISPVVFYTSRAYGDFGATFISPNIKQQMGYEPEEFTENASFWADNIHPDDKEKIFSELGELFKHDHHTHSYRFKDQSGHYRWMRDDLQLIRDENGEPSEIAGFWLDISARKQAEQALQESETKFRSIINSSPMGIFIYRLIDNQLIFSDYNPAANTILGIDCKKFVGKSIEQAFPELAKTEIPDRYRRVAREGTSWDKEDVFYDDKHQITGAFEMHAFQTEPNTMASMFLDVTERQQIQGELTRFKSTLDQTQDCVFMFDSETLQYFYVNQGASYLVGYSPQELMQMHPYEINNNLNSAEEFREFAKPLFEGKQLSFTFETEYRCKDQSLVPVEVILQHITHQEQAPRFVAMVRDITERRKIDRMKNEFVSTVSHELRTPLTSIRGSLGLITGGAVGELPPQLQQMLQIASNNTDRLLLLINDILDIQKIESGQMAFKFAPLDVMALLEQAVADNASYARQYNVHFEITLRKDGVKVMGDHDRLMQVLNNLMSNAAKFSPQGDSIELAVAQHGETVRISVTDHGAGIAEEFQPSLFEQFTQSDASDSRQKGGTGLGLSIVKAITDKHGGRVDYITRKNIGTTMFVELPLCKTNELPGINTQRTQLGTHQACILILEDDPDIAMLLKQLLTSAGYNCDIAGNAAEARQLLNVNIKHYKAMTLDIQLPDIDGVSFINELRSKTVTQNLPIVVVSVEADAARQRLNGGAIGIIDWLDKPIDEQRLLHALATNNVKSLKQKLLHIEDENDITHIVETLLKDKVKLSRAKNLHEAKKILDKEHFELILLDISLPDGSGLSLISEIEQNHPTSKLVIYSAHELAPEYSQKVHAVLSKSTTDNSKLLHTFESLLG